MPTQQLFRAIVSLREQVNIQWYEVRSVLDQHA